MHFFRYSKYRRVFMMLGFVSVVSIGSPSLAEDNDEHHQKSHVHGLASLFMVLDNSDLLIELESPAMNLMGFEHAPNNAEQHQKIIDTEQQLKAAQQIFYFSGGHCQLVSADITMPSMIEEGEHKGGHHDHGEDEHHEHDSHKEPQGGHSDVHAKYLFTCDKPDMLNRINIALMDTFPGIDELDVQWVIRDQQGAKILSPDNSSIGLQ